jgi:hypothetical protein
MPVLDVGEDGTWIVMPLADSNLEEVRDAVEWTDERILELLEQLVVPLEAAHDVPHGGRHLWIIGRDRALALHEHLLAGLVGEARGLDDHVAALGLAVAGRRLVEVVVADLAADDDGEDDEQDPADDRRLAVVGAPVGRAGGGRVAGVGARGDTNAEPADGRG